MIQIAIVTHAKILTSVMFIVCGICTISVYILSIHNIHVLNKIYVKELKENFSMLALVLIDSIFVPIFWLYMIGGLFSGKLIIFQF